MDTLDLLKERLAEGEFTSIVLENPDYVTAIVGLTENGNVVYDYEKMIDYLVNKENMSEEDAVDFISYNTIRAIPYMGGEGAMLPIIVYPIE